MSAYARLARLPRRSSRRSTSALRRSRRGAGEAHHIQVVPGRDVTIQADGDQLEQLLINLIRNAVDAALETGGGVRVGWEAPDRPPTMELWVDDEGPGLSNTGNLFVRSSRPSRAARASGSC